MTMDRVFIEDLRIQTVIGIFDWEREITQTISIDLQINEASANDAHSMSVAFEERETSESGRSRSRSCHNSTDMKHDEVNAFKLAFVHEELLSVFRLRSCVERHHVAALPQDAFRKRGARLNADDLLISLVQLKCSTNTLT